MIKNPAVIIVVVVSVEFSLLYLSSHPCAKHFFNFLPVLFWIYFTPMLLSTAGIIDGASFIYQKISTYLLPGALFLLLLTVDIKAILRLGRTALVMFFAGGFGVVLGMVISFTLFKPVIGGQFWAGFGALAGSWTGGSANMIAVKEALSVPDAVFLPMVIVDTVVPYVWMGILIAAAGSQQRYDRVNRSDRRILDDLAKRALVLDQQGSPKVKVLNVAGVIVLTVFVAFLAQWVSGFLPVVKDVISGYAWTIILVSLAGIACSLTPLSRFAGKNATTLGYGLLYFVLTAIGARASLSNLSTAGILIAAGAVVVLVHMVVLLVFARLMRAPLFLVAAASQANIGGVASAPMVAEVYQPGLSSVGLLLAILGNIIGTYAGILAGQLCRLLP